MGDIKVINGKFGKEFVHHNKVGSGPFGTVYEVTNEKGEKYGIKKSWIPGKFFLLKFRLIKLILVF